MNRVPLRLRVAAAFTVAAAVALVGLGLFVYVGVEVTLRRQALVTLQAQMDGLAARPVAGRVEATAVMSGEVFGQVLTAAGAVIASSPQVDGLLAPRDRLPQGQGERIVLERAVPLVEEAEPEAGLLLLERDRDQVLVVGMSREDLDEALLGVRTQLLVGGPLALLVAAGAGYLASGTAFRPMERMRRRAEAISAASAGERLPLPVAHDELRRLGLTLNQMLDRLDAGLRRERRFVAEAGHELRTPLALLKLELDLALAQPRGADELVAALRSAGEEVDRLTRLSEDLLLLASSGDGRSQPEQTEVDVPAMLSALASRFAARAATEGRQITVAGDGHVVVRAHAARVERALSNLVDNALQHGAGDVELGCREGHDQVSIWVLDHGEGMADDVRARAFEPFSRGSASRKPGGRGLGLALVRAIVDDHGGTITVERPPGDGGTVVTVVIPLPALR